MLSLDILIGKNSYTLINTIAIVGPESSGKSWLAKELAAFYNEPLSLEYSRKFLAKKNTNYLQDDLITIADGQLRNELIALNKAKRFLISDTSNIDIQVWSIIKYGSLNPAIKNYNLRKKNTYYILCYPDLPYEKDPLRESPNLKKRIKIFETFQRLLIENKNFLGIVKGIGESRLKLGISLINSKFNL